MITQSIQVNRTPIVLRPNQSRVLLRPYNHGDAPRCAGIVARILALPEIEVAPLLNEVLAEFSPRHPQIDDVFCERFEELGRLIPIGGDISDARKRLIGSYFLCEYSLESAALFNPSILPHPDPTRVPRGGPRFL